MTGKVGVAILSGLAVAAVLPSPRTLIEPYTVRQLDGGDPVTQGELRNYAKALIEVHRVRDALADAVARAPSAEAAGLSHHAAVDAAAILLQHDIDRQRFNQIGYQIDHNAALRRTVRQFVMQERVSL
jgi:hypothetical protein